MPDRGRFDPYPGRPCFRSAPECSTATSPTTSTAGPRVHPSFLRSRCWRPLAQPSHGFARSPFRTYLGRPRGRPTSAAWGRTTRLPAPSRRGSHLPVALGVVGVGGVVVPHLPVALGVV